VADRAAQERAFMALWLAGSLAADEHITADLRGYTGPNLRWDLGMLLLTVPGAVAAWQNFFGPGQAPPDVGLAMLPLALATAWTFASAAIRKIIYVAVTDRQVMVVQMHGHCRPTRVLTAAPIGGLRLTTTDRLRLRTVTWTAADGGPLLAGGKQRRRLRFTVRGRQSRLDDALGAVRAQGGLVDLPAFPQVPMPTRSRSGGHTGAAGCENRLTASSHQGKRPAREHSQCGRGDHGRASSCNGS
jgi:hypothetical protein